MMTQVRPIDIERARAAKASVKPSGLVAAMARARAEFPEIPRNRVATVRMKSGGQYSYNYADLADVFNATTPALSAYGLTIFQFPEKGEIVTVIAHESGEERRFTWPIKAMPARGIDDAQSYQSAVQVAKRYALTAALGISTEETVEGDYSRKKGLPENINENFETGDGIRMPRGAKFSPNDGPRKKAEAAAEAIIAQMDEVKTVAGLNGVWNRNESFIALLDEKHNDLYQNVFDKFHMHIDEKGEAAE